VVDQESQNFRELLGYVFLEWSADYAVVGLQVEARHMNRTGFLHGGVICTLLDVCCARAGCFPEDKDRQPLAVTLSYSVSFIGQTGAGPVRAVGRKQPGGRKIFAAAGQLFAEDGSVVAIGQGTYQYRKQTVDIFR